MPACTDKRELAQLQKGGSTKGGRSKGRSKLLKALLTGLHGLSNVLKIHQSDI
jgi:hypothetical protein